ncbi:MAG TPA: hypothetical protein VNZ22_00340 [Bacillota bacterium]|nr:hypothetical protein [Bacillota bacterium]
MKTPREILFQRHRQAVPKLDAVRRQALAELAAQGTAHALPPSRSAGQSLGAVLRNAWLELIWPSRRAWAGMAALWLAVLAANLEMKASSQTAPAARSAPAREVVQAFGEQQRLLAELLQPVPPPAIQAPRPSARPRSERPIPFKAC